MNNGKRCLAVRSSICTILTSDVLIGITEFFSAITCKTLQVNIGRISS